SSVRCRSPDSRKPAAGTAVRTAERGWAHAVSRKHDAPVSSRRVMRAGQARRWPARYTLVGLCFGAVFVCYIDRVSISVAVIAMQASFGWSETLKGLVLSSFFIGYLLFQVPAGYLANRVGGKLVLGAAVAWWSLATLITPAAAMTSLAALISARIA